MFGKAIGLSPEQSLALFTETPVISPEVASLIPPDPWDVETILKDMDEVFENLDFISNWCGSGKCPYMNMYFKFIKSRIHPNTVNNILRRGGTCLCLTLSLRN